MPQESRSAAAEGAGVAAQGRVEEEERRIMTGDEEGETRVKEEAMRREADFQHLRLQKLRFIGPSFLYAPFLVTNSLPRLVWVATNMHVFARTRELFSVCEVPVVP